MKVLLVLLVVVALAYGKATPKLFAPMQGRIIGGSQATPGEFPMIVSLKYLGSHRCGGGILTANHILTAAHCVDGISAGNLHVWVGAHNQAIQEPEVRIHPAASFVMHPTWNAGTIDGDVAVITLSTPIELSHPRASTIRIPTQGHEPTGPAKNIGWGLTSNGGQVSNVLMKVDITMKTREECRSIYQFINPITAGMVCAGASTDAGSCNGDSGSPLLCGTPANHYCCGVVSWGIGGQCGSPNYPSVFGNPAHFSNWIVQQAPGTQVGN